jgi:hypothetical protein
LAFQLLVRYFIQYQKVVKESSTPSLPPLKSVKVLDQRRERIPNLRCSIRTEEVYVHWVRTFSRFHDLRHAAILGGGKVEAFRYWLASASNVTASTHRRALSA